MLLTTSHMAAGVSAYCGEHSSQASFGIHRGVWAEVSQRQFTDKTKRFCRADGKYVISSTRRVEDFGFSLPIESTFDHQIIMMVVIIGRTVLGVTRDFSAIPNKIDR